MMIQLSREIILGNPKFGKHEKLKVPRIVCKLHRTLKQNLMVLQIEV